jgi:hypothetical protein
MAISYSPKNNLTYALLLFNPKSQSTTISTTLENTITNPLLKMHPLALPVLLLEHSILSSSHKLQRVDDLLRELEQETGQHGWADLPLGDPMELDFTGTTRTLNFASRSLGSEVMRFKGNLLILEKIKGDLDVLAANDSKTSCLQESGLRLKESIAYQINTCQNNTLRAEFQEKKVQSLIAVVVALFPSSISRLADPYFAGISIHGPKGF